MTPLRSYDNRDAFERSRRFFAIGFVLLPLAVWGLFLLLLAREPSFGYNPVPPLLLTAIVAVTMALGFLLTVNRTPLSIEVLPGSSLRVRTWPTRVKTYRVAVEPEWRTLERYRASSLFPDSCALVEIEVLRRGAVRWIVRENLLEEVFQERGPETS